MDFFCLRNGSMFAVVFSIETRITQSYKSIFKHSNIVIFYIRKITIYYFGFTIRDFIQRRSGHIKSIGFVMVKLGIRF